MKNFKQETTVAVEGRDGRPVTLTIRPLNPAGRLQVDRVTRKAYLGAARTGHRLEDDAGEGDQRLAGGQEAAQLRDAIAAGELRLAREDLSAGERRATALALRGCRRRLTEVVDATTARTPTAEVVALQAQFEEVVALCVYDATGRRLFRSAEQYRRRAKDDFSFRVAQAVGRVVYGLDYSEPPEEVFLRECDLAA